MEIPWAVLDKLLAFDQAVEVATIQGKNKQLSAASIVLNPSNYTADQVKKAQQLIDQKRPDNSNVGTWSIQEDDEGNPLEYNSKTGQTRAVTGLRRSGTKEKNDAAEEKRMGPGRDALKYGENYLASGQYTGPGDFALQEKYFELAKPTSGFKMTDSQMNRLKNSQSWMESVKGKAYHFATGMWFPEKMRQQLVQTMRDLQASHSGKALEPKDDGTLPGGISIADIDAELARKAGK